MEASAASPATSTPTEPAEGLSEPLNAPGTVPGVEAGDGVETGDGERDESGRYLSKEAARYRIRLRETEAERDSLRETLERVQRVEVERLASAAGLAVPGDVWMHGATVETLRADDGTIDGDAVSEIVGELLHDRPGLQAVAPGDVGIGRGGAALARNGSHVGLSALLKPGAR